MLPLSNWSSAWWRCASATVMRSSQRCVGLLKSSATFSTPVGSTSASAPMLRASRLEARSLSITASTPWRLPLLVLDHRDAAAAAARRRRSPRVASCAITPSLDDALRHAARAPRGASRGPASSRTVQPYLAASSLARASSMCEPIGLVGSGERRIVAIDHGLRHHRDRLALHAAAAELVAQRLDEHVADGALDVGAGVVHRHRRHFGDRRARSGAG